MRRAKGQENGEPIRTRDNRRENGRRTGDGDAGRRETVESKIADFRRRRARQRSGQERRGELSPRQRTQCVRREMVRLEIAQSPSISLAGHMGKKTPLERTPNQDSSSRRSVVPRSTRS